MTARILIAAGALMFTTSAFAQAAPGTDQTSEDLVCQLSDKCDDAAPSPADAAPAADASKPRISATRGFKIARKTEGSAASSSSSYTAKPAAGGKGQPRVAYDPGKKSGGYTAPKAKPMMSANAKALPKGRADLRVTFLSGSDSLTDAGQREAQKFAAALKSPLLEGMRFTIEGHTDAVGNRAYNQDLSKRRAQAVVDYMVGKGADRSRFDVVGYGFDRPLDGVAANAAINRRVEVVRNK